MNTIHELLTCGGCQYSVYELGRRIQKITKHQFESFESGESPYPFPIQGHGCFAVVFSKPSDAQQPYLWLLKLPLDEVSQINFSARDDFIRMVIEALGQDIANASIDHEALNNHPYAYKPSQEKLAVLNARVRNRLHQPASIFYEQAYQYFCKEPTSDGWQAIGVQGIADLVEQLKQKEVANGLANHISQLPKPAFNALALCLEHCELPVILQQALISMDSSLHDTFWLRSLAGSQTEPMRSIVLDVVDKTSSLDDLITLSARLWPAFSSPEIILRLLEKSLALDSSRAVFNALLADLSSIPTCRSAAHQAIRLPERSPELAQALGALFSRASGPQH